VEKVEELTLANRRVTVSDTVDKLGINHGSVHKIVYKELNSEKSREMVAKKINDWTPEKIEWSCAAGYWIDIKRKVRDV